MAKTYARIREKRPRGKFGTFMAYVWSVVYFALFATTAYHVFNNNLSATDMTIIYLALAVLTVKAVRFEFDGKWWGSWRDYPVKEREVEKKPQVFNVGLGAWEDDPNER